MERELFVAVGLGWGPGEDAEAVEIWAVHGPFISLEDALAYADRCNREAAALATKARRAQDAWSKRRGALFGDKYPLSDEEAEQLGPHPSDPGTLSWHAVPIERTEGSL